MRNLHKITIQEDPAMLHYNPLLKNSTEQKKFITMGEIMMRLTPPNYENRRDVRSRVPKYAPYPKKYLTHAVSATR